MLHGEKLLGIISTKGKMSRRFKCNVYTKCYCFLKFRSAAAQNLCDSCTPRFIPPTQLCEASSPLRVPFLFPAGVMPAVLRAGETRELLSAPRPCSWHLSASRVIHGSWPCRKQPNVSASLTSLLRPSLLLPPFPAWFYLQPPHHRAELFSSAHQPPQYQP